MEGCLHKMLLDALDQDTSCFGNAATDDNNVIQIASVDLGHDMELLTYAYAPAGG